MKKEAILDKIRHHLSELKQYPLEKTGVSEFWDREKGQQKTVLLLQFREEDSLDMEALRETTEFIEKIMESPDLHIIFGIGAERTEEMKDLDEEDVIVL